MRLLHLLSAPTVETHQRFSLEVDWDGDGSFANAYSDISSDVCAPVQTIRGRDYASQLTGRSTAGTLSTLLRNDDGRYSSFRSASPLYGKILPSRKVRACALTPYYAVLWTGYLDSLVPAAAVGSQTGEPTAALKAAGVLKQLGDQSLIVEPAPITNGLSSDVVNAVLNAANIGNRSVQTGAVPIGHWFVTEGGRVALALLQEMVDETELGWLWEGTNWDSVTENRYFRQQYRSTPSLIFSDDPASTYPYAALTQEDALRNIYNHVQAVVTDYIAQASAVVWTLVSPAGEILYLAPGASRTFKAVVSSGYVDAWVTPAVATDVINSGGTVVVSNVVKAARSMTFKVTNSDATAGAYLTTVQARGVLYNAQSPVYVESNDTTSQALYGKRAYPLPSPWHTNSNYAQAAADYFVSRQKDPHPVLTLSFPGASSDALALLGGLLNLSDRVTVDATRLLTMLGINQDFFVESIAHRFGYGIPWETTLLLSPAAVSQQFGIFDDTTYGKFNTTLIFAY